MVSPSSYSTEGVFCEAVVECSSEQVLKHLVRICLCDVLDTIHHCLEAVAIQVVGLCGGWCVGGGSVCVYVCVCVCVCVGVVGNILLQVIVC